MTFERAWPNKRLKYAVSLRHNRVDDLVADCAPYVGLDQIESNTGRLVSTSTSTRYRGPASSQTATSTTFERGDVLFGKLRPYLAKAWVAEFAGRCTTELIALKPRDLDPRFLLYVLVSQRFVQAVDASTFGSKMPRAEWSSIGKLKVPLPSIQQQRAIVNYLDRETEHLDGLVAENERILRLLAEKQQAVITHAVTCGLDPEAPTRDSGVPWVGEIPAHWETWKISHFAAVGNGSTPNRSNETYWTRGSIPWLNSSVVNRYEVTEADQFVTPAALRECHLPLVQAGSVLVGITGQGKTRGQATVLTFEATINQHMAFVTPRDKMADARFVRWALVSAYYYLRGMSDDSGGTKGALTCDDISNLRLALPALSEQRAIVAYISSRTGGFDATRSAIERTIALLRERRSALISAAVSGRVTVGSAA